MHRNRPWLWPALLAVLTVGCSDGATPGEQLVNLDPDGVVLPELPPAGDNFAPEIPGDGPTDLGPDLDGPIPDVTPPDVPPDGDGPDTDGDGPDTGCTPGTGCLGDFCSDHEDCLSGWCVDHLGEGVCTEACDEICPALWSCGIPGADAPFLPTLCLSDHPTLCRPCKSEADCKSVLGYGAVCVDHGDGGAFCGGACVTDEDCPGDYACAEALSVDGLSSKQCVPTSDGCPCSEKSKAEGYATTCVLANEIGVCAGERTCEADGMTSCDAVEPAAETCNGVDDDCDGIVDGVDVDCDDQNPCTQDACEGEDGCVFLPLGGGPCSDGSACTKGDLCVMGVCQGTPVVCDDQNPCTEDGCDDEEGCFFEESDAPCDDGNPCTEGDACAEGSCGSGPNVCACQSNDECSELEDGDLCNGTLLCDTAEVPYACVVDVSTVITCPGADGQAAVCLKPVCDAQSGACSLAPHHEGFACGNDDACVWGGTCQEGKCAGAETLTCEDSNPCTDDSCDPASGCVHDPNSLPCDDSNACTTGDVCGGGTCAGTGSVVCEDSNSCTDDSCDLVSGCQYIPNEVLCNDGDVCTLGDQCAAGVCKPSGNLICDDQNPCTDDGCLAETGCDFQHNDDPCSDKSLCTTGDTCVAGACVGTYVPCDDGNACTTDSCNPETGCSYEKLAPCCGNGDLEAGEACDDGNNQAGDGCSPGCALEVMGANCQEALDNGVTQSGIVLIDPDEEGVLAPFQVYCHMETDGGGWTLVAVSSDDGKATWTWNHRHYWDTDDTLVGSLNHLNQDFKSRALHEVSMEDMLFVHGPSGVWAAYHQISEDHTSLGEHIAEIDSPACYNPDEDGHPLSAGTLEAGEDLCDAKLYFNADDKDGWNGLWCSDDEFTHGPSWNTNNNNGCPFDDPGTSGSLGPIWNQPDTESDAFAPAVGFGRALGLNSGGLGQAINHMRVYVR